MTGPVMYFTRCGRAGVDDLQIRTPELAPLRQKRIAVFGLGCLGAPSAIEFARAGISGLSLLDHDVVDPGTIGRWPLGLGAAGVKKVDALAKFIEANYPLTFVRSSDRWLGLTRPLTATSDMTVVEEMVRDVDLVYDATAEIGVQHYLSDIARRLDIPFVSVTGSYGGWGGKVVSVVPGHTLGCWHCFRAALEDGTIPEPPSDPAGEVQAAGCGDISFTGAGFDMLIVALTGVRMAVSILCRETAGSYPALAGDVMTIALRDKEGNAIAPSMSIYALEKYSTCPLCCLDRPAA